MKCDLGWSREQGNLTGRCCCNCKHQVKILSHPWNRMVGGRMKGPVTSIAGWGCNFPELDGIVFSESQHSMCELHEWKNE